MKEALQEGVLLKLNTETTAPTTKPRNPRDSSNLYTQKQPKDLFWCLHSGIIKGCAGFQAIFVVEDSSSYNPFISERCRKRFLVFPGITDSGLEHLSAFSSLTRLHADNPGIGDRGLQNLSCLTSLHHLDLFGASKITSQGCVHLRQGLQALAAVIAAVHYCDFGISMKTASLSTALVCVCCEEIPMTHVRSM